MNDKTLIIKNAVAHANKLLGSDYSQQKRMRLYKGGSFDCSSYQYSNFSFAGFPLLDGGREVTTSCYEVYANGFDLIYPKKASEIGKALPCKSSLISAVGVEPGDLVFFNFNSGTSRANKITHIAMVYDKSHYIHTANNREKACKVPITWGRTRICAIIRLKDSVKIASRPTLKQGSTNKIYVRMLQICLNYHGAKLNCDGIFGSGTAEALRAFQKAAGLNVTAVCDAKTWAALVKSTTPKKETEAVWTIGRVLKHRIPNMKGDDVKKVQKELMAKGYSCGKCGADGKFGSATKGAVKKFQKAKGLKADGIVGKNTVAALGGKWGNK